MPVVVLHRPSFVKTFATGESLSHGQKDRKRKGALVFEDALHFDGDKPNSVARSLERMIIYLNSLA